MSVPTWNNAVVVLLLVFQAVLAAVIVADPGQLKVSPTLVAWLSIANVGVGVLLNQLKALGWPGGDTRP